VPALRTETLASRFIDTAKRQWSSFAVADSTGRELTFGRALVGSLLLSRAIRRLAPGQTHIGLLLPASVGGALANIGATIAGTIPVNLNFTAGRDAMAAAIERCGITTILSSRVFLSKAGLDEMPGMVFLEDVLEETSTVAKLTTLAAARLLPGSLLERLFGTPADADALATVIFSSGSTGVPKGVMLSHRNILANIESVNDAFALTSADVMIGVLPFFHSFGFTGTLWFPLISGFGVAYHPNPTDAKTIGELSEKYRGTLIISTPTFCGSYVRKIRPEQFSSLRYAIVGAEKLREPIASAFREKFGLDLLEGYGCTEMAPIVSVNLPGVDADGAPRAKAGTVGRPLPRVRAKVVDPVTFEGPLLGVEGLLLLDGPNKMIGYLGEPAMTRAAMRDGWYVTGDIAMLDEDGFIRITDRLSRFSKIAGEMVPHMKIEEEIQRCLADPHACIVTSVPDDAKGERLVAFHTDPSLTPQALWEQVSATSMPKLWIPKREDIRHIEAIPTLGTGKIDLRAVRQLALPADRAQEQALPGGREQRLQEDVEQEAGAGKR
jgi:acyl-[acyl-carrier-protein]-phospholipid O-acyltransferase/long-chain-fatty-acid--[acyl-carrier-protein] ligase